MLRWRTLDPMLRDAAGAALLIVAAFVPGVAELGLEIGELHLRADDRISLALLLTQAAALVLRRRRPVLCLAIVAAAFAAHQLAGYPPTVAGLALLVALYSAGAHQERRRRAAAVTASVAYAGLAVALHLRGSAERLIDFVTFFAVLAACWAAGSWVRARQAEEQRRRRESVGAAITAERARIARELHDVVTHHVTAMVVQSDTAGLLVGPQPDRAVEAIAAVSRSGREALTELRVLLGVLDGDLDERTPAASGLADLVDRMRRAGQPVDFAEEGGPGPDGGLGLAVHRVVQEGLTNAVRHARGRPTRVLVRHDGDGTAIEVVTAGSSHGEPRPGRGLTGLRERITVFGGTFDAAGGPEGDFRVRAWLPRSRAEASSSASPSGSGAGGDG
ncbi:two-component sensor histidine kinase [Actinoplanes philippinensis]|uniref:histidine kinase n=1 Tax=Actinoplanes philippinensis TaxID=35752 RepID=A0A1I2GPB0_9ACTN|nr:histidine kinase [Actinoplanes philippinensis]GIE77952.1 two-component sensor histidine kinase [Actinoplanes philippinensis]SFF19063.1 Signal transduction histidine kinase [Actinoplanes philippinensis]